MAATEETSAEETKRKEDRMATNQTVMFTMDDEDDDDDEDEDDNEQQDDLPISASASEAFGGARLSFMFEHNNLINMRINALANDLRNGNLLLEEEEEAQMTQTLSRFETRRRRKSSVSSAGVRFKDIAEENKDPNSSSPAKSNGFYPQPRVRRNLLLDATHETPLTAPTSETHMPSASSSDATHEALRKRIEELEAQLRQAQTDNEATHADQSSAQHETDKTTTDGANIAVSIAIPTNAMVSDEGAVIDRLKMQISNLQAEAGRRHKEIKELRDKLQKEKERASGIDKECMGLRKDLRKCQHVIERLVKELEHATQAVNNAPAAPVKASTKTINLGQRGSVAKGSVATDADAGTAVSASAPAPADASDAANNPSLMTDLSSAIGSFFGSLGTSKENSRARSDTEVMEPCLSMEEDEPFCWTDSPCSKNVEIDDDGQTVTYVGSNKDDLHAFVVTEEPPLLEGSQGYGFEVLIEKVREGHEDGLAIGFTATPPDMWPEELPETADRIDMTFLVGYNGEFFDGADKKKPWTPCPWSPSSLCKGDRVGVQMSLDGQFFVVLNQKVVFSTTIAVLPGDPPLFGIVDLIGNTDSVVLLD